MRHSKTSLILFAAFAITASAEAGDFPAFLSAATSETDPAPAVSGTTIAQPAQPVVAGSCCGPSSAGPAADPGMGTGCPQQAYCQSEEASSDKCVFGVMPFYAFLQYGEESIKSHGNVGGSYFYLSNSQAMLEFNGSETDIAYRTGFDLSQQDYTTVVTLYPTSNIRFRMGNHEIANNDPFRTNADIWFGGLHYFVKDEWEAGVDAYVSLYNSYVTQPLTVTQVTPRVAYNFDPTSWVEAKVYYIHDSADFDGRNFVSGELRLGKVFGDWTVSVFGYAGEQIFAVRADGFIVWNLQELHHGGFGGDIAWKIDDHTRLTIRLADELFKDLITQSDTYQFSATVLLMFTF